MKIKSPLIPIILSIVVMGHQVSWAESTNPGSNRDAFHAALKSCSEKYGRPKRGEKPSTEFADCMTAAGFERPPGPPPEDADADESNQRSDDQGHCDKKR